MYSLAAIAYELISGRRMTPTGWDELSAEDGPELRAAFASALSPDPAARPVRAADFAANAASGGPAASKPVPVPSYRGSPRSCGSSLSRRLLRPIRNSTRAGWIALRTPVPPRICSWISSRRSCRKSKPLKETSRPPVRREQPPKMFQIEEPAPARGRGRRSFVVLLLIALAVAGMLPAYLVRARRAAPPPAAQATPPPN